MGGTAAERREAVEEWERRGREKRPQETENKKVNDSCHVCARGEPAEGSPEERWEQERVADSESVAADVAERAMSSSKSEGEVKSENSRRALAVKKEALRNSATENWSSKERPGGGDSEEEGWASTAGSSTGLRLRSNSFLTSASDFASFCSRPDITAGGTKLIVNKPNKHVVFFGGKE